MKKLMKLPTNQLSGGKKVLAATVLTGATITALLFLTTPERLGPGGITAFFGLVFLFILGVIELYYRKFVRAKTYWPFWLKVMYTALPVVLLALSSLRQLGVLDALAAIGLVVIVNIYHNRGAV